MSTKEFRTSRWARLGKLGAATLGASAGYMGNKVGDLLRDAEGRAEAKNKRLGAAGRRLAETMGELKGAAMKLGQLLSIDNELLPEEMRRALSVLQRQAPAMPFSQVKFLVEERLGAPLSEFFSHFDEQVLGAASLGQVHAATLIDGQAVAIKVQYPGIAKTIGADMANLRALLKVTPVPGLKGRVDPYIDELTKAFVGEADYRNEAANLTLFNDLIEGIDGLVVPRPVLDLCRPELLVMERLEGRLLGTAWPTLDAPERNRIGTTLIRFYAETFHRHQWLHADPHPGNFLLLESGELGILDFGCVRQYDVQRTDGFLRVLQALWSDDDEAVAKGYADLGFGHGKAVVAPQVIAQFNRIALAPFLSDGPFDFGAWSFADEMRSFVLRHPEFLRLTPEPDDLLYLRVLSGLRGILNEGNCLVDARCLAEALCAERF